MSSVRRTADGIEFFYMLALSSVVVMSEVNHSHRAKDQGKT
jgi:hypothetical protein